MNWSKDIVQWQTDNRLYLSVVFTWDLPKAQHIINASKKKVVVGGNAVKLMPDYLMGCDIRETTTYPVLQAHNPFATFTTRGCPNKCGFCAVPKTEGDFRELQSWYVAPMVCDNNILASSKHHFESVINSLTGFRQVDFNQGLDMRLLEDWHIKLMQGLSKPIIRFAFDSIGLELEVVKTIERVKKHGFKDIRVYCLIGYDDTPDEALYKLELIRSLGALPNPMRFQPLYALEKNSYVADGWSDRELKDMCRYYSNLIYFGGINYQDYKSKNMGMTLF